MKHFIIIFFSLIFFNSYNQSTISEIRSKLHQKPIHYKSPSLETILGFVPQKIMEAGLNTIFITYGDIAKFITKYCLYFFVKNELLFDAYLFTLSTHTLIDYGCEGAWAGFYDGPDTIARSLFKKLCIDCTYKQLTFIAEATGLDYPECIKREKIKFILFKFLANHFMREFIGNCADSIFQQANGEENDDLFRKS
jgi:hypothetical protein